MEGGKETGRMLREEVARLNEEARARPEEDDADQMSLMQRIRGREEMEMLRQEQRVGKSKDGRRGTDERCRVEVPCGVGDDVRGSKWIFDFVVVLLNIHQSDRAQSRLGRTQVPGLHDM